MSFITGHLNLGVEEGDADGDSNVEVSGKYPVGAHGRRYTPCLSAQRPTGVLSEKRS